MMMQVRNCLRLKMFELLHFCGKTIHTTKMNVESTMLISKKKLKLEAESVADKNCKFLKFIF